MPSLATLLLLVTTAQGVAVPPDCTTLLAGLQQKITANYAGHLLEVKGDRAEAHRARLATLTRDAARVDRDGCRPLLQALVDWYDDPHLFLFQSARLDSAETRRRMATVPTLDRTEAAIRREIAARGTGADPIEGIWHDRGMRYGVIPDPSGEAGRFVAIVLASDTATVIPGMIGAEFHRRGDRYEAMLRWRSLAVTHPPTSLHRSGTLLRLSPVVWGKSWPLPPGEPMAPDTTDARRPTFAVAGGVPVITIPSHQYQYRAVLDALLAEHRELLAAAPFLVVDLRGNEGGSSVMSDGLLPYIVGEPEDDPDHPESVPVMLSSPDQIRYAKRALGSDTSAFVRRLVAALEGAPGELVPLFDGGGGFPPHPDPAPIRGPARTAILVDRGTVSAAEVLVLKARRSARAVVIGEPTAGALDYQSTSIVSIHPDEAHFFLGYPTITARAELPGHGMRGTGIAPEVSVVWDTVGNPYATARAILERRRAIGFADLDSLATVTELVLAPDGRTMAFRERGEIWVTPSDGSLPARSLGPGMRPAWSPDGRELVLVAPDDARSLQLFRVRVADGSRVQLTRQPGGVAADQIAWSRRDEIVFTADVAVDRGVGAVDRRIPAPAAPEKGVPLILDAGSPDGYALHGLVTGVAPRTSRLPPAVPELFLHSVSTGSSRQLTSDARGYHSAAWSPDGRYLVAGSRRATGDNRLRSGLWLVDASTGHARELVPEGETDKGTPEWSPDGRAVAYQFHSFTEAAEHGVGVVTIGAGAAPRVVYRGLVTSVAWADEGASLLVAAIDGVTRPLSHVVLASGRRTIIGSAHQMVYGAIAVRRGVVAWLESSGTRPSVIKVRRDGETLTVHDANRWLSSVAMGAQEIVTWRNRHGHERFGVLIKPVGYRPGARYPLVVSAYTQTTHLNGFQSVTHGGFANQGYAGLGYMVFFPGPRVPWTYGSLAASPAEAEQLRGASGWDVAVDDVESGVDYLIDRGLIDSTRMAIIGFSNGGAVAAAVLTRTDRYRVVVAVAPANLNWVQNALFEDDRDQRWIPPATFTGIGRPLHEDPLPWVAGSPVFHLGGARSPTLLAVGDRDTPSFTLPTIELYLGLRRMGRDVALLRYAEMGHGFHGPAGTDLTERVLRFIEERIGMTRSDSTRCTPSCTTDR